MKVTKIFVEKVVEEINNRKVIPEVTAECKEITKVNTITYGIVLNTGNRCSPVVYLNDCKGNSVEDAVIYVKEAYNASKLMEVSLNEETLKSLLPSVRMAYCKASQNIALIDKLIGSFELDLYRYYYLSIDSINGTMRITEELAKYLNVSEPMLYDYAQKNRDKDFEHFKFQGFLDVITNSTGLYGAEQMFNITKLDEISTSLGDDLAIMPSSVHEVIIIPKSIFKETNVIVDIIKGANETAVREDEVLSDHPYFYIKSKKQVTM